MNKKLVFIFFRLIFIFMSLFSYAAYSQSIETVNTKISVTFKPNADPEQAQQEFESVGITFPTHTLHSEGALLVTPDASCMPYVKALRADENVQDVDYTNSNCYLLPFGIELKENTAYLLVKSKNPVRANAEKEWLREKFPAVSVASVKTVYPETRSSKYLATLTKRIRRALVPPSTWGTYIGDPATIKVIIEPTGQVSKIRFTEKTHYAICNSSAYKAVVEGLSDKVDYNSCIEDSKAVGPIELEILFLHKDESGLYASHREFVTVRRIDSPDDLNAPDWSDLALEPMDSPNILGPNFWKSYKGY